MTAAPENPVAVDWMMTIPVISTAHMPHAQAAFEIQDVMVAPYAEGAFVCIGYEGDLSHDAWLAPVREWLNSTGSVDAWVRFDAAGDIVECLKVYEWAEVIA